MKKSIHIFFSLSVTSLLGFIFIFAAISKIVDMPLFQNTVQSVNYLPSLLQKAAILWLPGLELVVGFCLLCRIADGEAALIAGCLMMFFLWISLHANMISSKADCGCFKMVMPAIFTLTGWWIVLRDFLLLLGCQYLVLQKYRNLPIMAGAASRLINKTA